MHAHIDTHNAVIDQTDHLRWSGVVGARSRFQRGESESASSEAPTEAKARLSVSEYVTDCVITLSGGNTPSCRNPPRLARQRFLRNTIKTHRLPMQRPRCPNATSLGFDHGFQRLRLALNGFDRRTATGPIAQRAGTQSMKTPRLTHFQPTRRDGFERPSLALERRRRTNVAFWQHRGVKLCTCQRAARTLTLYELTRSGVKRKDRRDGQPARRLPRESSCHFLGQQRRDVVAEQPVAGGVQVGGVVIERVANRRRCSGRRCPGR